MAEETKKKKTVGFKEFDPKKVVSTEPTLDEAYTGDVIVVSFGRMNPVTVGHEKLVNAVQNIAIKQKAAAAIHLSKSQDPKKNPLSYNDKVNYAKKAFGNIVKDTPARTIIEVAKGYSGKYKKLIVVVGSDRVKEFDSLLNKYNRKEYNYPAGIEVMSAGDRDPDSSDVSGMSASKMRAFAQDGDLNNFTKGLPKRLKSLGQEIMDKVSGGLNEETEDLDEVMSVQQRRQAARRLKRAKSKIGRGRKRALKRKADAKTIEKRAQSRAKMSLKNKFSKGKYKDLSLAQKVAVDKKVAKISPQRVSAIAKKLRKDVKADEMKRRKGSKNEQFEQFLELREASLRDCTPYKKPHMAINKEGAPRFDFRFKMFRQARLAELEKQKALEAELEEKTKCPQCDGQGCDHCNGTGYHEEYGAGEWGTDKLTKKYKKDTPYSEDVVQEAIELMNMVESASYYKGVDKDDKENREKQFARQAKMRDDDPKAYKPAPGDKDAKTKPSQHTKKFKQMFGEEEQLDESNPLKSLRKKAEQTGIAYSILKDVFDRGVAAWKSGHRPGTTPAQWGLARVNSFATGGKTRTTADADLWAKHKGKKESMEENLNESTAGMKAAREALNKLERMFTSKSVLAKSVAKETGSGALKDFNEMGKHLAMIIEIFEEIEMDYMREELEEKKAPKIKDDFLKKERERNRKHDAAMGRTATGRKKPAARVSSTKKSLADIRKEAAELEEGILKPYHAIGKQPWSKTVKDSKGTAGEYKQIASGDDFTVWYAYRGSNKSFPHYVVRDDKIIGSGMTVKAALKDAGLKDKDIKQRSKFADGSPLNKGMKEALNVKAEKFLEEKKKLSAKEIKRALQNVKAQPKDKVSVKKAPWDENLEEALGADAQKAFTAAGKDLKAYATKNGGIDKKDFMEVAKLLDQIGRVNILQAGQVLGRLNKLVDGLDTEPREKIFDILEKHGLIK